MLQLISIALFALAGFSSVANAAPTHNSLMHNGVPMASTPIMNSVPINWKRDHHQQANPLVFTEAFIKSAVAEAMAQKNMVMVKRDDAPGFDLSVLFRGVFDKIVDHIIEVTPLNDIVHGNYDFLYDLFLTKVNEAISGTGAPAEEESTTDVTDIANKDNVTTAAKAPKPAKDTTTKKDDKEKEEENDDEENEEEDEEEEGDNEDDDEEEEGDNEDDDDEEEEGENEKEGDDNEDED